MDFASEWGFGADAIQDDKVVDPELIVAAKDLDDRIDDACDDLTTSAGTLDSVARLGARRSNPKWCEKTRNVTRKAAHKQVLGIAVMSKRLIPLLQKWFTSGKHFGELDHKPLHRAMSVYNSIMPPLASNLVAIAALSTLPNRGEEVITVGADLWIGIAELLQVVRNRDEEALIPAATEVARAAAMLLATLKILTPAEQASVDKQKEEIERLERDNAAEAERFKAARVNDEAQQQEAAIAEVERITKQQEAAKAKAQRENEAAAQKMRERIEKAERKVQEDKDKAERKQREEQEKAERKAREDKEKAERKAREDKEKAERKAREEADKRAREEAKRIAREEAQKQAREAAEAKRKAKEEDKRRKQEEAERKAREKLERKAKFAGRMAMFEQPTAAPPTAAPSKKVSADDRQGSAVSGLEC